MPLLCTCEARTHGRDKEQGTGATAQRYVLAQKQIGLPMQGAHIKRMRFGHHKPSVKVGKRMSTPSIALKPPFTLPHTPPKMKGHSQNKS